MPTRSNNVEYLTTTAMGEKGQVTVPKQFRDDLGLQTGAPLAVLRIGNGLIFLPQQQQFEELCEKLRVALTAAGIRETDLLATLPEVRKRIYARKFGGEGSRPSNGRKRRK
jgi:AbrB family looped-hinge helix DNA binding protein